MKYVKVATIEAVVYDKPTVPYFSEIPQWLEDKINDGYIYFDKNRNLRIKTLEGLEQIKLGYYIVKDTRENIYGCDPEMFREMYRSAEDE